METTRHRGVKKIQMKSSPPYSQSWSNSNPLHEMSGEMKKCSSLQRNKEKIAHMQNGCCWTRQKPLTRGCDPYAPHLKYGLFTRKVSQDFSKSTSSKLPLAKKMSFEEIQLNNMVEMYNKDRKNIIRKGQHDPPLFRIRPIDKQYARQLQLSMSKVTHVDIKPRKNVPPKRNTSPFESSSPSKVSNRLISNKRF